MNRKTGRERFSAWFKGVKNDLMHGWCLFLGEHLIQRTSFLSLNLFAGRRSKQPQRDQPTGTQPFERGMRGKSNKMRGRRGDRADLMSA
eukprot:1160582-Pelagomonas_calceolata.AAC.13